MKYKAIVDGALLVLCTTVFAMEKLPVIDESNASGTVCTKAQMQQLSSEFIAELDSVDISEDEIRKIEAELLVDGHKLVSRAARYKFFKDKAIPPLEWFVISTADLLHKRDWVKLLSEYEIILYSKLMDDILAKNTLAYIKVIFDCIYTDTLKIFAEDALYRGVFPTVPYGVNPVEYYRSQWAKNDVIGAVINLELLIIAHSLCIRLLDLGKRISEFKPRIDDLNEKCQKIEYMADLCKDRTQQTIISKQEEYQQIFQLYDEGTMKATQMSIVRSDGGNLMSADDPKLGDSNSSGEETKYKQPLDRKVGKILKKLIFCPRFDTIQINEWSKRKFGFSYPFKTFPWPHNKYELLALFLMSQYFEDKDSEDFDSIADYMLYLKNNDPDDPDSPFFNTQDIRKTWEKTQKIMEADVKETLKNMLKKRKNTMIEIHFQHFLLPRVKKHCIKN